MDRDRQGQLYDGTEAVMGGLRGGVFFFKKPAKVMAAPLALFTVSVILTPALRVIGAQIATTRLALRGNHTDDDIAMYRARLRVLVGRRAIGGCRPTSVGEVDALDDAEVRAVHEVERGTAAPFDGATDVGDAGCA